MSVDKRVEEYLREAKKAEELAASAADEVTRHGWLKIAENYHALAKTTRRPE